MKNATIEPACVLPMTCKACGGKKKIGSWLMRRGCSACRGTGIRFGVCRPVGAQLPGETITPLPPRRTVPQTADGYELTPNAEVWAMLLDPGCTNAWTPERYTIYAMTARLEISDGYRRRANPDQVYFSKKAAELEAARREEEWRRKNRDVGQYGPGPA